jgi:hypothetical protein
MLTTERATKQTAKQVYEIDSPTQVSVPWPRLHRQAFPNHRGQIPTPSSQDHGRTLRQRLPFARHIYTHRRLQRQNVTESHGLESRTHAGPAHIHSRGRYIETNFRAVRYHILLFHVTRAPLLRKPLEQSPYVCASLQSIRGIAVGTPM